MLSNNKFLGKCWYGGQPWIQLAMESESMVEKGIKIIFCLGTAYDVSSMESVGSSKSFSLVGKVCHAILFTFMQFLFLFESPSSLMKHQLGSTMSIVVNWM